MFDLLITGGTLVDGTGAAARVADAGVRQDRIAAIGDLSAAEARRRIDATGLVVAPGFIDAHAHSDAYLLLEPDAPSKLAQGITTEINGQCGGSAVPRLGQARLSSDWASHVYPQLDEARRTVSRSASAGPTWTTVADYRALFDAVRPALNTVQFIGHNTLRAGVMGYAPRAADPADLQAMLRNLEQALDEGGWGLSTGLLYQPGKYAEEGEIDALVRATAAQGGLYATHMRSEGEYLLESISDVLELARRTGIRAQISHLKTAGLTNWHKIEAVLEQINAARAAGVPVHSDRYPYTASGTDLDVVLPDWASAGGRDAILANLRDPATRGRIVDELNDRGRDWMSVMIGGGWSERVRAFSGRTLADAADTLHLTPGETVCRFVEADETRTGAFFFGMSMENLRRIYAQPWVMPGSDASLRAPWGPLGLDHPHPRAYGTMPRYLRLMTGLVPGFAALCGIEEAVRRMTALPAQVFGLRGRGVLRVGAFADIVVFDPQLFTDSATYAQPHQFAQGMRHVIVNGALAYSEGTFTGIRRGRFLEREAEKA
ncbi:MAG TPA: D-aminoacylase [Kiritimatiellia bacterium]|mgnify:FL=1|nr:D-aminoacylase [Kiritimatiellia bacterium]HRU71536.1 D-aminoacylase [Kiritimatiellia bacterium]